MNTLSFEIRDQVSIISLDHGVTNSLNFELISELADVLKVNEGSDEFNSLVLTSNNDKFFSIGFDIPELINYPREQLSSFYRVFNLVCMALYTLPIPTVAAIKGHAVAGGTILALCCDYRFIAEGHKLMGLNEIKLGVPVPYPGDCILRQIVGDRTARDVIAGGEFFESDELNQMGLVDGVLPLEQVLPAAIDKAKKMGRRPCNAYEMIKDSRVESVVQKVNEHSELKSEQFVDCWYSSTARERLIAAMEKF